MRRGHIFLKGPVWSGAADMSIIKGAAHVREEGGDAAGAGGPVQRRKETW